VLLEREKSSATKDTIKSVPVALLTFLAASSNLSVSFSAAQLTSKTTQLISYQFKNKSWLGFW